MTHDTRPGWWPGVVGAGSALDPDRFRLIGVDYIGGRGGSWRPAHDNAWPALTTHDQAAAIVHLLDALDIERLHAIVGASYGGMVALALAERHDARVERVVAICAAHRPHPMATALRSVQRRIIRLGTSLQDPAAGVAAARALAMTTYRTSDEFAERFAGEARVNEGVACFPVDAYLDHHGHEYAGSFPADALLALSQSIDLHSVDPARITVPCSLICFDSDTLVPPADVRALQRALAGPTALTCIRSRYGHDGFLKEVTAVNGALRDALDADCGSARQPPPRTTSYAARVADPGHGAPATAANENQSVFHRRRVMPSSTPSSKTESCRPPSTMQMAGSRS
jgi:homoserine O-acetyltransferase